MMIPRLRMRGIFIVKGEKYNSDLHGRLLEPGRASGPFRRRHTRKFKGNQPFYLLGSLHKKPGSAGWQRCFRLLTHRTCVYPTHHLYVSSVARASSSPLRSMSQSSWEHLFHICTQWSLSKLGTGTSSTLPRSHITHAYRNKKPERYSLPVPCCHCQLSFV
jgi:hypothetical protein